MQILSRSTSKSAPNPRCFNDFDFQIALARRRGANFVDILDSRSFATPVFRTHLCELSKRQNYGKTQHFAQFLPAKTSLLWNIDAARATGNFQYSRKLELLNFLWLLYYFTPNSSLQIDSNSLFAPFCTLSSMEQGLVLDVVFGFRGALWWNMWPCSRRCDALWVDPLTQCFAELKTSSKNQLKLVPRVDRF